MHVFTKRNALVGWIVTRLRKPTARKRLERRLKAIARGPRTRRKLVLGAGIVGSAVVALGAFIARRSADGDAQPA
jgi:hypothetical protein